MKLINVKTRKIHEFISDAHVEPYAILSHTWGEEEVSFEEYQTLSPEALSAMKGYTKIDYCCKQAEQDGYLWAWVDTCCIDKRSSAELSEAINSMFRWYQQAAVCYAFLVDVDPYTVPESASRDFRGKDQFHFGALEHARWFTRGWTLQELLAPREVIFYSRKWTVIGSRSQLSRVLYRITRIDEAYLRHDKPLSRASVGKRMSWASRRTTTRVEDMAYCLLGIFNIHMPLLYGEGKRAFLRLQEEILRFHPLDHTLFAWGRHATDKWVTPEDLEAVAESVDLLQPPPWDEDKAMFGLKGLFAESPEDFEEAWKFIPWRGTESFYISGGIVTYPTISGPSVVLALPVFHNVAFEVVHWQHPKITQLRPVTYAMPLVVYGGIGYRLAIALVPWGQGRYTRTVDLIPVTDSFIPSRVDDSFDLEFLVRKKQLVQIEPRSDPALDLHHILIRRWGQTWKYEDRVVIYHGYGSWLRHEGVLEPVRFTADEKWGIWAMYCRLDDGHANPEGREFGDKIINRQRHPKLGFAITFLGVSTEGWTHKHIRTAALTPLVLENQKHGDWYDERYNWRWCGLARIKKHGPRNADLVASHDLTDARPEWIFDIQPFPLVKVVLKHEGMNPAIVDITILERTEENRRRLAGDIGT